MENNSEAWWESGVINHPHLPWAGEEGMIFALLIPTLLLLLLIQQLLGYLLGETAGPED